MLEPVETETWQEKPGDDQAPFPAAPDPAADRGARSRGAMRLLVVAPVIAAAMVVTVLVAASARTLAIAGQVPGGTRVAGVEIGGLSPKVAEARLYKELADDAERPIKVTAAGQRFTVAATEAGLALDAKATVAATGHSGLPSPADLLRPWLGARDVEPRLKVEQAKLAAVVDGIAKQVDKPPREGGIRYSGTRPVVVKPKPGTGIDRAKTQQAIRDAFLDPQPSVTVAAGPVQPSVSLAKANEIARTTAREAVAAPIRLTNAGRSVSVPPSAIARGLKFVPDGKGSLRPQFNAKDVAKTAEKAFVSAAQAPRNATFDVKGGRLELVPARTGKGVDAGKLGEAITKVLAAGGTRTVPVSVVTTPPSITDQQARAMGIKEKISSFTTQHPCCAPRVTNIQTVARILDGHIVKPGETFSLNRIVGQRDRARGFVPAPMILNGRFVDDVGGGISQFVTTMFNAVFFAGLQNVQHTPHSFYISRYPAGRESTVSYPEPDFRWRNDSPHGVLVKTSYTGTSITVDFWGTKRYDIESQSSPKYAIKKYEEITESGDKCTPMPGADGFSIDVYRIFKKDGRVVRRQKFHTVYLPEPKLTCKPKAEDQPGRD